MMFKLLLFLGLASVVVSQTTTTTTTVSEQTTYEETTITTAELFRDVEDRLRKAEKALAKRASADAVMGYHKKIADLKTSIKDMLAKSEETMEANMKSVFETSIDAVTKSVGATTRSLSSNIEERIQGVDSKIGTSRGNLIESVNTKVDTAQASLTSAIADMRKKLDDQLAAISGKKTKAEKAASDSLAALQKTLDDTVASMDVEKNVADALKAVDTGLAKAENDVKNAAYPTKIMWSGGCNNHGSRDGWKPYCHSNTEFNTAGDYLQLTGNNENSEFVIKQTGWYRINWWGAGQRHWNYVGIWRNGNHIHYGREYTDGNWHDHMADLTWKFEKGEKFYINIYGSGHGSYQYHSWNSGGEHSRLQVEYLGVE